MRSSQRAEKKVTKELAVEIQNAAVAHHVFVETETRSRVKVLSNLMVDMAEYVDFDPAEAGVTEAVLLSGAETAPGGKCGSASEEELKEAVHKSSFMS